MIIDNFGKIVSGSEFSEVKSKGVNVWSGEGENLALFTRHDFGDVYVVTLTNKIIKANTKYRFKADVVNVGDKRSSFGVDVRSSDGKYYNSYFMTISNNKIDYTFTTETFSGLAGISLKDWNMRKDVLENIVLFEV